MPSLYLILWQNLMLFPEIKNSPCFSILSIFGCKTDLVPKVLVEISSVLLSKNSGPSITAKTSSEILLHLIATFSQPSSASFYSLVIYWVIGTEQICLSPSESVMVFILIDSINSCSFMNLLSGKAHPSDKV